MAVKVIRVLIADDHMVVRQGIRQILGDRTEFLVVGEASTGAEVLSLLRQEGVDVLILDMSMPGRSGIDTIKQIRGEQPKLQILVLSMHAEDQYALRAFKAGAAAYLTKGCASEEILAAIRKLASGHPYITPAVAELLALDYGSKQSAESHKRLSDREFQIFRILVTGKSISEIADELCISSKTVSTYKARILEKMQMSNVADLIHYAIEHGLTDQR